MAGVRILLQFTADSAERADELVKALATRCQAAQQEPGCLQFEAFRSVLRPETYALVELWESQKALEEHERAMGPRTPAPGVVRTSEHYSYQPRQ